MKASIVVATFNRQAILSETLSYLLRQDCLDYEIIVVDQTPTVDQALRTFLHEYGSRIRYYVLPTPNLPAARNFGVGQAKGDVVIFVDDDVTVQSTFVGQHVRHYENEFVDGVTGLCVPPGAYELDDVLRYLRLVHNAASLLREGDVTSVSWLPGCHMSFRKGALLHAGPFDENFTGCALCEDVDMSIRLATLGYRLIADTNIRLVHLQVREGGCAVRSAPLAEEKARERFSLASYCWLKHWRYRGLLRTGRSIFHAYRTYALNRNLLRVGFGEVIARQIPAITELVRAGWFTRRPQAAVTGDVSASGISAENIGDRRGDSCEE